MTIREKRNRAKFHAYLTAARCLEDIVSARMEYPDKASQDDLLSDEEYSRIAKRLEKTAMKYREGFE